jgi:hypothetical protein
MIYTIQRIINRFQEISDDHQEIFTFGYGNIDDIDTKTQGVDYLGNADTFIGIWVDPLSTQLVMGRNNMVVQRRFAVYCYDLQRQDQENLYSIWNQTEQILIDVCRLFNYGSVDYKIVNNPILTPFKERFSNDVNGYWAELSIQTMDEGGVCNIPIT